MRILGIIRSWFTNEPKELTKQEKRNAYYRDYYAKNKEKIAARRAKSKCESEA